MKAKKLLVALPAMALIMGGLSISPAFAAEEEQDVLVSYDNTQVVVDPDNPITPTWGVSVPTRIVFTETIRSVGTNVKLVDIPATGTGVNDGVGTNVVSIKLKSANGYKVQLADGTDPLSYAMVYGGNTHSGIDSFEEFASLTSAAREVAGTATLGSDIPTVAGTHTDQLTYQISSPVAP